MQANTTLCNFFHHRPMPVSNAQAELEKQHVDEDNNSDFSDIEEQDSSHPVEQKGDNDDTSKSDSELSVCTNMVESSDIDSGSD